eukprot:TRINITY_DN1119_c0_g4_i4.p1 TRINITY_DN1119_c0_g4~~TRINITY_DN1119_c0_g4_i4.p1  ORF type:complete len:142 (-),score=7.88 TRINITY_DN1119_c0_g4_i4:413-838(-)
MGYILATVLAIALGLFLNKYFSKKPQNLKTLVILGSGGHTSEMFKFFNAMPNLMQSHLNNRIYIVAKTDIGPNGSENKACEYEDTMGNDDFDVCRIPRSREVGESWASSFLSTIIAFLYCFGLVLRLRPHLVYAYEYLIYL